ncbi:hypothetical protein QBC38DRAFT_367306 [Podospora fimiseda]|uniref:Uncharacterized protein n=1 Tax=Podospora fimiseda TaxID=252190 RepID=A0AAN7BML2_9PEZI|nr:hypothetical protein QBC38DRAFT_367306 [Podospora fimiseda]
MASNQTHAVKDPQVVALQQEEEKLEEALKQLNQLHLQLREVRSAIPRMLEPLMDKQPSAEAMYATFMKTFENTTKELSSFRDAYWMAHRPGMPFNKAQEGFKKNPQAPAKQWHARDDPTWAECAERDERAPKRQKTQNGMMFARIPTKTK